MLDKFVLKKRADAIVSEHNGVHPMYIAFYSHAIYYESGRAKAAFERFNHHVTAAQSPAEIVASVHEALGHVAALSRFFFSSNK